MNTLTPAQEHIQMFPTDILAAAVRGEIDLNRVAALELASRGFDRDGKWVGFEKAAEIHKA